MSSTINVNYMTRTYSNFLKGYEAKNGSQAQPSSFSDRVAEKSAESQKVSETGKAGAVSTKDMTMEEYKQYIHDKISQIPMHPSRMQESISINISEAGFEAMKNDPEYEAWVLNDLRTGWAQPDRWAGVCGGAYSTIYYGATKEECHVPFTIPADGIYEFEVWGAAGAVSGRAGWQRLCRGRHRRPRPCGA